MLEGFRQVIPWQAMPGILVFLLVTDDKHTHQPLTLLTVIALDARVRQHDGCWLGTAVARQGATKAGGCPGAMATRDGAAAGKTGSGGCRWDGWDQPAAGAAAASAPAAAKAARGSPPGGGRCDGGRTAAVVGKGLTVVRSHFLDGLPLMTLLLIWFTVGLLNRVGSIVIDRLASPRPAPKSLG